MSIYFYIIYRTYCVSENKSYVGKNRVLHMHIIPMTILPDCKDSLHSLHLQVNTPARQYEASIKMDHATQQLTLSINVDSKRRDFFF